MVTLTSTHMVSLLDQLYLPYVNLNSKSANQELLRLRHQESVAPQPRLRRIAAEITGQQRRRLQRRRRTSDDAAAAPEASQQQPATPEQLRHGGSDVGDLAAAATVVSRGSSTADAGDAPAAPAERRRRSSVGDVRLGGCVRQRGKASLMHAAMAV